MPTPGFLGLRVLDLSQGIAGPSCTQLMAQHGAQVIKVEPPEGDWARQMGAAQDGQSCLALAYNRGKHSLSIDLKSPQGAAVVRRVAAGCDVVVESFRPGVAQRLGVGFDALSDGRERLVYASIAAFGDTGPYASRGGTDTVMQAFGGMMDVNRDASGTPNRAGFMAVDIVAGLHAFGAIGAALYGGGARHLKVSLMQACAATLAPQLIQYSIEGVRPRAMNVPAGVYATRDGSIVITLVKETHWRGLCEVLGHHEWIDDARFSNFDQRAAHADLLKGLVGNVLALRDVADWVARFDAAGVPASPVHTLRDWLEHPAVTAIGAAPEVQAGRTRIRWPRLPAADGLPELPAQWPAVGEHGAEVLAGAGFAEDEIESLVRAGVLHEART